MVAKPQLRVAPWAAAIAAEPTGFQRKIVFAVRCKNTFLHSRAKHFAKQNVMRTFYIVKRYKCIFARQVPPGRNLGKHFPKQNVR